jgi:hypothetical protein
MTDHDTRSAINAHFLRNAFHAPEYRLSYIATPKAACTTFKWWMASLLGVSREANDYAPGEESSPELAIHDALPALAPHCLSPSADALLAMLATSGHFSFAIVRNPYTRLFSAWQSKIFLREPLQAAPYSDKAFFHAPIRSSEEIASAFEQFLEHLYTLESPHYWDVHWTPQFKLLRPDAVPYTKVARLENLGELYEALATHLGRGVPLPSSARRTNESLIPFSRKLLSDRAIEIICTLYAQDFERFGYSVEPPQTHGGLTEERVATAIQAVEMIRGRHVRMVRTRSHLSAIITDKSEDLAQLRNEFSRAANERDQAHRELAASMRERDLGNLEREQLRHELSSAGNELSRANNERDQAHRELAASMRERDLGNLEREQLRQRIADHEQALAAIYASRSWRVVAPARAVTTALRRLRSFVRRKLIARPSSTRRRRAPVPGPFNAPRRDLQNSLVSVDIAPAAEKTNSPLLLIVADLLPLFDQASGGLRLKTLIDMMGVAGWSMIFASYAGLDAQPGVLASAQGRARYETALRQAGVKQILYGADEIDAYIAASGQSLTWAFLSFPAIAARFLPVVRSHCPETRVIYDMVDFHSVRLAREAQLNNDPKIREEAIRFQAIETACAAAADVTLAVTEDERSALLTLVPDAVVEVLPNVFEIPTDAPAGPENRAGLFFVGGFWHKPNSDAVRWFVKDIFPRLRREIPELVFSIAGANAGDEVLALAREPGVEVLGFVEDLEPLYRRHRVFVAPLRYGAGMKGKVGQSLAYGLPVVATSIGAEGMGLQNDLHLLVADDEDAFAAQILRLLKDNELWARLSTNGREHLRKRYSVEAVRDHMGAILGG